MITKCRWLGRILVISLAALLVLPLLAGGSKPKVRIVAYINVSSGCQVPTVDFLKSFAKKHPKDVTLELVDFGSDAGAERWRGDGYSCETIVINGSNQFRLKQKNGTRVVIFKMPEGVRWSFEDLSAVLMRELKSPRSSILSDSQVQTIAKRSPIASRRTRWHGKAAGEVLIGSQAVFRFVSSLNGDTAVRRAEKAASVLKKLYAEGLKSDEIQMTSHGEGADAVGILLARSREIARMSKAEANLVKRPPEQAVRIWVFNLREGLRVLGR